MRIVVRGYGDGKLLFEDRVEVARMEQVRARAKFHLEAVSGYERYMIEIEFLDETDPFERFFRFGSDNRGMVVPLEVTPFVLPTHCGDCGAVLMGGATRHKPGCAFQAIIDQAFGQRRSN